jgi:hypothetical protein
VNGSVTYDEAPPQRTIEFGIGQPFADLLLVNLLRQATERSFDHAAALLEAALALAH